MPRRSSSGYVVEAHPLLQENADLLASPFPLGLDSAGEDPEGAAEAKGAGNGAADLFWGALRDEALAEDDNPDLPEPDDGRGSLTFPP